MGSLILFLLFCQGGRLFGWGRLLGTEEYISLKGPLFSSGLFVPVVGVH